MVQFRWLTLLTSSLSLIAVLSGCSTPPKAHSTDQEPATVEIDQALHFFLPSGEDVTVLPGSYGLKGEKFGLRIIAKEGLGEESILVEAKNH